MRFSFFSDRSAARVAGVVLTLGFVGTGSLAAQTARSYSSAELHLVPRTAVEDGGPRNWEVVVDGRLNLRDAPSTRGDVVGEYEAGAVLDNLGCSEAEGRTWCDVQEMGGGPRGYVAADFLRPALSPDGSAWAGPDRSALRAGVGDFDARGMVRCGTLTAPLTEECPFSVARGGGGYATVQIGRLDGGTRTVFYRMGIPIGADISEAEGAGEFEASRRSDNWTIWIGEQMYDVPDAVVLGG